jgi:hypothetical protein
LVTDSGPGFERLARRILDGELALECVDVPPLDEASTPAARSEGHRKIGG